jgi:anti-sigma regulatory factor (Ser/Thr protein kinase)
VAVSAPTTSLPRGFGADDSTPFSHEALLYQGETDFLAGTVPFIQEGIDNDEALLVVVDARKIARIREVLGCDANRVRFADMSAVGRNPARIIPAWQDFVSTHAPGGRPMRGIGEPISASRTADQLIECQRHESLLNVAFEGGTAPWRLLCPYDVRSLTPLVIEEARRSHPYVADQGLLEPSLDYRGVEASGAPLGSGLPAPPVTAESFEFSTTSLRDVRVLVHAYAARAGLDDDTSHDLALAAHEIAANSTRYGGGQGVLQLWSTDAAVICEIGDGGQISAPLAGRERPPATNTGGRGLWLANQLCDLVQIRTRATGGVVRLHEFRD